MEVEGYQTRVTEAKKAAVQDIRERLKDVQDFVFTDYRGLTVQQMTDLRTALRERNGDLKVIKNRTAQLALEDLEKPDVSSFLVGPTALALSQEDPAAIIKALLDASKEAPLEIKGGLIDGTVFDATQVEALSKLPTREELLGQLAGVMQAPVRNLLYAMNGVMQNLVRALRAVAEQKEGQGGS